MCEADVDKLVKKGGKRWKDNRRELRIRLRKSCVLPNGGEAFYHEVDCPKGEQITTATLSKTGELLDITLFTDRL